ncbi:MAG: hypothetical protein J4F28_01905 [Nitrosopumilaceae archaeon]|nr:hypothetical protein [Nitrosopumilaceae archaeon]
MSNGPTRFARNLGMQAATMMAASSRSRRVIAVMPAAAVMAMIVIAAAADTSAWPKTGEAAYHVVNHAYAQQQQDITVSSISVGGTNLITITSSENAPDVSMLRLWLSSDSGAAFKSFKTEIGWTGQKTPQGVVVFTTAVPLKPGGSVKFGVETDAAVSGINWKAVGQDGVEVATGRVTPGEMPEIDDAQPSDGAGDPGAAGQPPPDQDGQPPAPPPSQSITSESDFRIIPLKPSVGATIRIAGEEFGLNTHYDFYINNRILGGFTTGGDGAFVTTVRLPSDLQADRVNFAVRSAEGDEVVRSLRLSPAEQRPQLGGVPGAGGQQSALGISGITETAKIGDRITMEGSGRPGSTLVVYVTGPDGAQIKSNVVKVDGSGSWSVSEALLVGADMKIGNYSTIITDGFASESTPWSVVIEEGIQITSDKLKYDRNDVMRFNITTINDEPLKVHLENPNNVGIYSDIINTNGSDSVVFDYETSFSDTEGTYTLIATQGDYKQFLFVGVNELPQVKIRFDLDKVNYRFSDVAIISIVAKPSDTIRLNILDSSDNIKYTESLTVQSDGRGVVALDLDDFDDGIYTAELEKGTEKTSKEFTIGLQSSISSIEVVPIKPPYYRGEQFLISVDTGDAKVPLTITMTDPDGEIVTIKETFSTTIRVDKDEDRSKALEALMIPSHGKFGTWTITVSSGGSSHSAPVEVIPESMSIQVLGIKSEHAIGRYIDIMVVGAEQSVWIQVSAQDGTPIGSEQKISITGEKVASAKWAIPDDVPPGTYVLKARDTHDNTAEAEIDL